MLLVKRGVEDAFRVWAAAIILAVSGCHGIPCPDAGPAHGSVLPIAAETPRELFKATIPAYTIEPPDILVIQVVTLAPKEPYHLKSADQLAVEAKGVYPDAPISGVFLVQPSGNVDLGLPYGSVRVVGMTVEEARAAIRQRLLEELQDPRVHASLVQIAGLQQIGGEHLVKPDGTVRLGSYGSVFVTGMTLDEAEAAVEAHLGQYLQEPDVALDVFAFNSKFYYVVLQGAGLGDQLIRLPYTGNETVIDAISQIGGLSQTSSKRVWVARPGLNYSGEDKILPVDYDAIARRADIATNYQLLPGDRLYVEQDQLIALDTHLSKIIAPVERLMGFTLLGTGTATRLSGNVLSGGGNPIGAGGF